LPAPISDADGHLSIEGLRDGLATRTARGGAVTVAAQLVKVALQIGTIAILARLLDPADFGLIAMAAVLLTFLEFFKDLGLSSATVQRERISHDEVSALFWINVGLGVATAIVTALAAPLVAWFYREPKLAPIVLWLSLGFLLSGLTTQHLAILRRRMRFGTLAAIQLSAEAGGMATAVIAAFAGMSYWSLVAQRLVWIGLMAAGAWIACGWRPGRPRRGGEIMRLVGFGGNITLANLINFFAQNLDQILIGWYWGPIPLGLYERAIKLILVPINNINTPLFTVFMPALSRLADDAAAYRRTYLGALEKIAMVTMPASGLLIAIPDTVVRLVFGPNWSGAVPIVGWLGVAMLYLPVGYTSSWLFVSQDRTRDMVRWSIMSSIVLVAAIGAAVPFGAVAVAASFSLSGLFLRMPILLWLMGRRGPVRVGDIGRALVPSMLAAASVAIVAWSTRVAIARADLAPLLELALVGAIAALAAAACYAGFPRSRRAFAELARLRHVLFRSTAPS